MRFRRHTLRLHPIVDPRSQNGVCERLGPGTCFLLESPYAQPPSGWARIQCVARVPERPLDLVLRTDDGKGAWGQAAYHIPLSEAAEGGHIVRLPDDVRQLRLEMTAAPDSLRPTKIVIDEIGRLQVAWHVLRQGIQGPSNIVHLAIRTWNLWRQRGIVGIKQWFFSEVRGPSDYARWTALYDTIVASDLEAIVARIANLRAKPVVSIALVGRDWTDPLLHLTLESIDRQAYPFWELCVAANGITDQSVRRLLPRSPSRGARVALVRHRTDGSRWQQANAGVDIATGEFTAVVTIGDQLPPHALFMVAKEVESHPEAAIVYSDEDKVDETGRRYEPNFKPDWNPDLMLSRNLIGQLALYRTSLLKAIGGMRAGLEGSEDYDLALRAVAKTSSGKIRHIPHVLCHRWSPNVGGDHTAKAQDSAQKAVRDFLEAQGIHAEIAPEPGGHRVTFPLPGQVPLVSLIIPTKDAVNLLRVCVSSVLEKTTYPSYEILVVDNQSEKRQTRAYLGEITRDPRIRVVAYDRPYNFAALNNFAARLAHGPLLCFLNNDVEVISPDWLGEMVRHALRPEIGPVGAMLYYPDDTIQHAGIVIGLNGTADHAHKFRPRHDPGYCSRARLTQNVSAVTAACMVIRRELFEAVGGFDVDHFGIAYNDVDLCLRLWEQGYRTLWTPFAELYHYESATLGAPGNPQRRRQFQEESQRLSTRWNKYIRHDPFYNPNLSKLVTSFELAFPPAERYPWLSQIDNSHADSVLSQR